MIYIKTEDAPKLFDLALFRDLLKRDRQEKMDGNPGIVFHPFSGFKKQISLKNKTLFINYFGTSPGHTVANEFTLDLYRAVLFGEKNIRNSLNASANPPSIVLTNNRGLKVKVHLQSNCQFNLDTLEGDKNLRLHRALTDCIEIESPQGNDFSYQIQF